MICGASKVIITPSSELLPNLRGLQDIIFEGILDDLYIRAFYINQKNESVLLVSFDLDKVPFPEENIKKIANEYSIPEENIVLYSIHTHTAPVTGIRVNEGPNVISEKPQEVQEATRKYEAFLTEKMMTAVKNAIENAVEAKIGFNYGESYINMNRIETYFPEDNEGKVHPHCGLGMNLKKEIDHKLFVMEAVDLEGQTIALFINYPVHNCIMIRNKCGDNGGTLISSDMAGNMIHYFEERFEGTTVLWSSGAAADINPLFGNEMYYPDPMNGQPTMLEPKTGEVPLAILKMLSTRHLVDVLMAKNNIKTYFSDVAIGAAVEFIELPATSTENKILPDPYVIRVQLVRIGDLAVFGASGELFSSSGEVIKTESGLKNVIIINHDASLMTAMTGYIFDDETLKKDKGFRLPGHRGSLITPGYLEQALKSGTRKLMARVFT